jgi:hypothetical protein
MPDRQTDCCPLSVARISRGSVVNHSKFSMQDKKGCRNAVELRGFSLSRNGNADRRVQT